MVTWNMFLLKFLQNGTCNQLNEKNVNPIIQTDIKAGIWWWLEKKIFSCLIKTYRYVPDIN